MVMLNLWRKVSSVHLIFYASNAHVDVYQNSQTSRSSRVDLFFIHTQNEILIASHLFSNSIILNRPKALNALNDQMLDEILRNLKVFHFTC